jgi:hypothetical protein
MRGRRTAPADDGRHRSDGLAREARGQDAIIS